MQQDHIMMALGICMQQHCMSAIAYVHPSTCLGGQAGSTHGHVDCFIKQAPCAHACRYARTGKDSRLAFDQFTKSYFLQRNTLATVLLLIDSSIPPQPMDFQYASWLAEQGVPFTLVFTKHDKRKKKVPGKEENITAFKRGLIEQHGFEFLPPSLVTSANTGLGKAELQKYIGSLCLLFQQRQVAAPKNQSSSAANVEYKVPKQLQPN